MKRALVVALVGGFAAAFAVAGFPALAADQTVNAQNNFWDQTTVNISVNDTVTWANATGTPHNICVSRPGSPQGTCDEVAATPDPATGNWTVPHQFTTDDATYRFRCNVHTGMTGQVIVGNGSPTTTTGTTPTTTSGTNTTPTTTTSPTSTPTTTSTTTTSPGIAADTTAPRFTTTIRRRSSRRVLKLTFGVSENAALTAALRRRPPGGRTYSFVSKTSKAVTAGSNTVSLLRAGRRLRAGAYRLTLVLKDGAGNKSSPPKVLNFKLA